MSWSCQALWHWVKACVSSQHSCLLLLLRCFDEFILFDVFLTLVPYVQCCCWPRGEQHRALCVGHSAAWGLYQCRLSCCFLPINIFKLDLTLYLSTASIYFMFCMEFPAIQWVLFWGTFTLFIVYLTMIFWAMVNLNFLHVYMTPWIDTSFYILDCVFITKHCSLYCLGSKSSSSDCVGPLSSSFIFLLAEPPLCYCHH